MVVAPMTPAKTDAQDSTKRTFTKESIEHAARPVWA